MTVMTPKNAMDSRPIWPIEREKFEERNTRRSSSASSVF
jgi:hypothetical protein